LTEFAREAVTVWRTRNLIQYVLEDLEKRVKKDKPTKLSVFFTALSAYMRDPTNLFLKGPPGVGKTYNVVETLRYFPVEDTWMLGGLSPKALIHDHGVLLNKYGEPIDMLDRPVKPRKHGGQSEEEYAGVLESYKDKVQAWREEIQGSYTLIDLSHKILVFLEAPEYRTFHMLYPILSHDTERISYRFTDKTSRGQLRTSKVVIQGWPATIFLTVDKLYVEELATRSFTATPEASAEKIMAANILTNRKASYPWQYNRETEEFKVIKLLVSSIRTRFIEEKMGVVVPFPNLHAEFPKEIVRDMRDFQHFTQLLKTIAALNFYQRPFMKTGDNKFLLAGIQDVKEALQIYSEIFETTRTGTEERILTFYRDFVKDGESPYLKQLTALYNDLHEKKASSEIIRRMLMRLSEIGYVNIQRDDEDKRLNVYVPLVKNPEMSKIRHVLETWTISAFKLEKDLDNWRKNILQQTLFYHYKKFSEDTWGEAEINIENALKLVSEGKNFRVADQEKCRIFSKPDSRLETEKKRESVHESKTWTLLDISEVPEGPVPLGRKREKFE